MNESTVKDKSTKKLNKKENEFISLKNNLITKLSQDESVDLKYRDDFEKKLDDLYIKNNNAYYHKSNPEEIAFMINGKNLRTNNSDFETVSSIVEIAVQNKWSDVKISGDDEFKSKAWLEASLAGISVRNYEPSVIDTNKLKIELEHIKNENIKNKSDEKENKSDEKENKKENLEITKNDGRYEDLDNEYDEYGREQLDEYGREQLDEYGEEKAPEINFKNSIKKDKEEVASNSDLKPDIKQDYNYLERMDDYVGVDEDNDVYWYQKPDSALEKINESCLAFQEKNKGDELLTNRHDNKTVSYLIAHSVVHEWDNIKINGAPEFKSEAWLEASLAGVKVTNYEPNITDINKLKTELEHVKSPLNDKINSLNNDKPEVALKKYPELKNEIGTISVANKFSEEMLEPVNRAKFMESVRAEVINRVLSNKDFPDIKLKNEKDKVKSRDELER